MEEFDEDQFDIRYKDCVYTSYYCEENVWKLCERLKNANFPLKNSYCVFISNDSKFTPLWLQKAGPIFGDYCVTWDYHVIFIIKSEYKTKVYDFDSLLGFPTDFRDYLEKCIRAEDVIPRPFHRFFRVIPAEEYLKHFASDRSHMKNKDGDWLHLPPPYDPIQTYEAINNLQDFIEMQENNCPGRIMNWDGLNKFFMPPMTNGTLEGSEDEDQ